MFDYSTSDISEMTSELYRIIYESFEQFIPKTTVRSSNKPVWSDKHLSHLKNARNKEYKKLCAERRVDSNADDSTFLSARNEYEDYRKQIFSEFLRKQASNLRNDSKVFWRHING